MLSSGLKKDRYDDRMCNKADQHSKHLVSQLVAHIDVMMSSQLSVILHHARFQQLEALWRSLKHLVSQAHQQSSAKIRILSLTRQELIKDTLYQLEFDQSQLFRKIYTEQFDTPGGQPYGLMILDYYFSHLPQDLVLLRALSSIATASFCPFVGSASPRMLGVENFSELGRQPNLLTLFSQAGYQAYNQFRRSEEARFMALCLPQRLLRLPYYLESRLVNRGFFFTETKSSKAYLWGNAAFALAETILRAFNDYGWFGNLRGYDFNNESDGQVEPIVRDFFSTDRVGVKEKINTQVFISDQQEKNLHNLGFIALSQRYGGGNPVFYSNTSLQKSNFYDSIIVDQNANAATLLQYMLCASRFAHYLKIMARDKIGSYLSASDCESMLNDWLKQYIATNTEAPEWVRAQYPLHAAKASVREDTAKTGHYACTMYLKPVFQVEQLTTNIILTTDLNLNK